MIKKILGAALFVSIASITLAQKPVAIQGVLTKERPSNIKLFKIEEGQSKEISSSTPNASGNFGFTFYPDYEGMYVLGTGTETSPNDNFNFWLKEGDALNLAISDDGYTLTGNGNSKENIILTEWYNLVKPIELKSVYFMKVQSTFVDFFPVLEEISGKVEPWLKGKKSGNKNFDNRLKDIATHNLHMIANNFLTTPRSAHPANDELSDFYLKSSTKDLFKNTANVYLNPWGKRGFGSQVQIDGKKNNEQYKPGLEGVQMNLKYIDNDTLKGDFVIDYAARLKDYQAYQDLMKEYGKYVITKSQKDRSFNILTPLLALKTGDSGLNFSYPDRNGKQVTFADLKGKVVLIDVWATWCGPCIAEIPHLKKLEEELRGKDVAVVSISVDEAKDKEKWLKYIKDENLGGIQLFASGWGNLAQYYKITGIPRFMVFDKEGKIVSIDSPRPSSPELKQMIEKALAK